MGTRIEVVSTGQVFEPLDIQQVEDVFTTNVNSNSGGIPMITVTLPPHLDFLSLVGEAVKIDSSTLGSTSGVFTEITVDNTGSPQVILNTKLNPLVRLARAKPFAGKLQDLIRYYFKLAGMTSGIQFASGAPNPDVRAQGWEDVIWTRMIKLQQVHRFEVALVSDFVEVRPWRTRTADIGHIQSTTYSYTTMPISRKIEIDYFSNTKISNKIVYPIEGVKEDSTTITANAREVTEVELELSASVSSIKKPEFRETISRDYNGTKSVYTVIDKNGYIVKESFWRKHGGRLTAKIGPDSKSIIVTFVGPNYSAKAPYKVAFAPLDTVTEDNGAKKKKPNMDLSFNSLYIVGTGIGFKKRTVSLMTGARPQDIVEDVGAQISEPEISSMGMLANAALPVLVEASGGRIVLSGTIARINQRGRTGALTGIPVEAVEDLHPGTTYGMMEDDIHAGKTYGEVEAYYNQHLILDFDNQAFGNAAGARIFDPYTRRWFRITSATVTLSGIQFEAEDDLTYGDVETWLDGKTYGYVEDELWPNLKYWDVELKGLK